MYEVDRVIGKLNPKLKSLANLGFFEGARLTSQLLEGTGKGMRHVKVRTLKGIKEREIVGLLKKAAKLK